MKLQTLRAILSQSMQPQLSASTRQEIVATSPQMRETMRRLGQVAPVDTTVLLNGESGTGKEVAARFLHDNHPWRRTGPFVCLHCGAIPDTLLESELFGYTKGAFTGAERDRQGKFEQANGGTIFLDEISTMKPESQVRLLRVLQERMVSRVGSSEPRAVDVRVVVASNQDLKTAVGQGTFRLDLYHRVSTFPVHIAPLRERRAEIRDLTDELAGRVAKKLGLPRPKRFRAETLELMMRYSWPGNVRELENAIEYASIVSDDRYDILPHDLPPDVVGGAASSEGPSVLVTEEGVSFRTAVGNLERDLILQSLRIARGNKARAAELLDLKRTTFLEKLGRLVEEGGLDEIHLDRSNEPPGTAAQA